MLALMCRAVLVMGARIVKEINVALQLMVNIARARQPQWPTFHSVSYRRLTIAQTVRLTRKRQHYLRQFRQQQQQQQQQQSNTK
jgi:hypothetical protein